MNKMKNADKKMEVEVTLTRINQSAFHMPRYLWHKNSSSKIRIFQLTEANIVNGLHLEYGLITKLANEDDDDNFSNNAIQEIADDLSTSDEVHCECRIRITKPSVSREETTWIYSQNTKVLKNIEE